MANLAVQALGVASVYIYTLYMNKAELGLTELFNNHVKLLLVLASFNFNTVIGRYYYEGKDDYRKFFGTSIVLALLVFGGFLLALAAFPELVARVLSLPIRLLPFLALAVIANMVFASFNVFTIAHGKTAPFAWGSVAFSYLRFGGAWIALVLVGGYYGRILGDTIGSVLVAVGMIISLSPHIRLAFQRIHLPYIFRFSLPLIPYMLSAHLLHFADSWLIAKTTSMGDAGLYAFAYKIGFLLLGLNQALHNAAQPEFYRLMNEGRVADLHSQTNSMQKIELLGAGFLILFSADFGRMLSARQEFEEALYLIPFIVAGYIGFGAYQLHARLLYYVKRTVWISVATLGAAAVNIGLNIWLLPLFGYGVAAYTTLVSFLVMFGIVRAVCILQRLPYIPWTTLARTFVGTAVLILFFELLPHLELSLPFAFGLKCLVFLALGIYLFGNKLKMMLRI